MAATAFRALGLAHSEAIARARAGVEAQAATWGEGFEDDEWADLTKVRDWRLCAPDEYIRVFPALLARDGREVPSCLVDHLAASIRRIADGGAQEAVRRRNEPAVQRPALACLVGRWMAHGARRRGPALVAPSVPTIGRETTALESLRPLLDRLRSGSRPPYDAALAAELVFWAGIHPVYVWPEALLAHERFTALGWLGHATRAGRAFLLRDVAAYFQSVLTPDEDGGRPHLDPALAPYLGAPDLAGRLLKAARQRMIRPGVVVDCSAGDHRRWPALPLSPTAGV